MTIPEDIKEKMESDFGLTLTETLFPYLLEKIPEGLPNGTRDRHLRCVLHLAGGDPRRLDDAIDLCRSDPRDVMLSAEYVTGPRGGLHRVRDYSRPFGQSELD